MDKLFFLGVFLCLLITVSAKFCAENSDCNSESTCVNGLCTCDVGKLSSNDGLRCLDVSEGIGSECQEDIQCLASITGPSVCTKDFLCGCKSGYIYVNDTCAAIQGYKGSCSDNSECFDGINLNALKCQDEKCICSEDYYLRGDSDCRLSAKSTKKCLLDIDCQSDIECCEFIYGPLGDCVSKLNSNNTCSGIEKPDRKSFKVYENINVLKKKSPLNKVDRSCDVDSDCSKIENSFCLGYKKKCVCKNGFLYNKYKNICVKGLGSQCDTDVDCPILHSYCNKNKVCTCQDYFINSNYNDKCFKPARGMNMSCGRDENCYSLGIYGTCNNNKCGCKFNSEYDEEQLMCQPTNSPETNGCEDNCEKIPHSTCVNNRCKCDENYKTENNRCLPDIGFECNEDQKDCVVENAECKNSKCECMAGYLKVGNRLCIKEITEIDECVVDAQCEKYLGAGGTCTKGNCTCSSEYEKMTVNEKDACVLIRQFGGQCASNIECKTILKNNHVVCRNLKCVCDYDYNLIEDEYGQRCASGSSTLLISNLFIWTILGVLLAFN